jgi:hypothetical protein
MNDQNIFEIATRQKVRFHSPKGQLSCEDLFDLPLTSASGPSLDGIAKGLHRQLKDAEEFSLVSVPSKASELLQLQFAIVKHVFEVKKAEAEVARLAREKREQKQRIMEIMSHKQDEALQGKSLEELQKMMDEL